MARSKMDLIDLAPDKFAKAAASSFVADVYRSPDLQQILASRMLTAEQLKNLILRDLARGMSGEKSDPLFPNLRSLLKTEVNVGDYRLKSGMNQFDFSGLINAVTGITVGALNYSAAQSTAAASAQRNQVALQMAQIQADSAKVALAAAQGLPTPLAATAASVASTMVAQATQALSDPLTLALFATVIGGGFVYFMRR